MYGVVIGFIIANKEIGIMWITDIVVRLIPDSVYLKYMYRRIMRKKLDLKNPRTFNEKLQWLKLHDRKPEYTKMVDKYEVRKYIKKKIGEQYLIPLVGGPWDTFDDIDFSKLPDQFVLKCTHDSGSVAICKNKKDFDIEAIRKKFNRALKGNFFYGGREWPYKNVKPRIIAEKYMADESGTELKDYKIFNFNGIPKIIQVDYNRFVRHKRNLYSTDWKYMDVAIKYETDPNIEICKPVKLDEMLGMAQSLSQNIPHIRTDFYSIGDRIYFGELTFYHESGFGKFMPDEWDKIFGDWLMLPNKAFGDSLRRDKTE